MTVRNRPAADAPPQPIPWWRAEPERWARDRDDITAHFPDLQWSEHRGRAVRDAGGWRGRLPLWPFDREPPVGIERIGPGLQLEMIYHQAYPMAPPAVYPLDPADDLFARTDHRWHLNGDGSLCLLQTAAQWDPRTSVIELLLKAGGWRLEHALMTAGLINAMSESGIVSDTVMDGLLAELVNHEHAAPGQSS